MIKIIHADCVEGMKLVPMSSVQLCVTSPPYDQLRSYGGKATWNLAATVDQLMRILVTGGVICWVIGDQVINGSESLTSFKQAIYFVEQGGFRLHDTMIYQKNCMVNPERGRYHPAFEYVFCFSKGRPKTFNPLCDKYNTWAGITNLGTHSFHGKNGKIFAKNRRHVAPMGMRTNVWKGNTRAQEHVCKQLNHPAMMPRWLVRDLIISFSNPGDIVIDPFAGSGTTGEEAEKQDRNAILIDNEIKYVRMMRKALK